MYYEIKIKTRVWQARVIKIEDDLSNRELMAEVNRFIKDVMSDQRCPFNAIHYIDIKKREEL